MPAHVVNAFGLGVLSQGLSAFKDFANEVYAGSKEYRTLSAGANANALRASPESVPI
jgi:hypothetical protein